MNIRKYFGTKEFYKSALLLGLPVMAQCLVQNLIALVDNFMVAGLGDIKMSGVNICGQVLFAFYVFTNTICASGGIFLTQFFGAKDKKGMKDALRFKIIACLILMIFFFLVTLVFPRQVLSLMVFNNTEADLILNEAIKYMKLMAFIGIPNLISVAIATSFREIGKVKAPLYISIVATLINTFFNYMFIYGNLGAPRLEVVGAAYATIIAKLSEMIIYLVYINIKKPDFLFKINELFNIDIDLFKKILKKSGMIMFSEGTWVLSETITTAIYNSRGGADVVAGMSSSFAIANLYFVVFNGVIVATGVILGKLLGEGKLEEAKVKGKWLLNGSIIFGCIAMCFGLLTSLLVPVVFSKLSINSQTICRNMVVCLSFLMPLWVYNNVQFATSRAGGDTKMGIIVDGVGTYFVMYPLLFFLAFSTDIGPVELYIITKLIDIPKVIFCYIWLKKEYWVKNLTVETA